jgi:GNAT superfamily N-acetyltransferase
MIDPRPPHDLACSPLSAMTQGERERARRFCLETIGQVYGTDYRPDWHADLDSLPRVPQACWFSPENRGAFWTLSEPAGEMVATAGLYRLGWKPKLVAAFADRYAAPGDIVQLVRVYVRRDRRGQGIGRWLTGLAEAEARRQGFDTLYLHADTNTKATIAFWRAQGFAEFANDEGTTHFDKRLASCGD